MRLANDAGEDWVFPEPGFTLSARCNLVYSSAKEFIR
jgi:hypothetical protein